MAADPRVHVARYLIDDEQVHEALRVDEGSVVPQRLAGDERDLQMNVVLLLEVRVVLGKLERHPEVLLAFRSGVKFRDRDEILEVGLMVRVGRPARNLEDHRQVDIGLRLVLGIDANRPEIYDLRVENHIR